MSAVSPFWAIILTIWVLLLIRFMAWLFNIKVEKEKFQSIAGLRGYLAYFVFIHHASSWHFLLQNGSWDLPPSNLYNHLGLTSVSLFFMITSFLFFGKLIDAKNGTNNWRSFFLSRFLRIYPLYALFLVIMIILLLIASSWKLNTPLTEVIAEIIPWILFIQTNINQIVFTKLMSAGVVWSLAFEFLFYFSLPMIGTMMFNLSASAKIIIISIIGILTFLMIVIFYYPYELIWRLMPFISGAASAYLARINKVTTICKHPLISLAIICSLIITVLFYSNTYSIIPFLLVSITFIGIACGNDIFGILTNQAAKLLGQISYSIYMLHGFTLFICFRFVFGFAKTATLSIIEYWILICVISIVLILACTITYKLIELPSMRLARRNTSLAGRHSIHNI